MQMTFNTANTVSLSTVCSILFITEKRCLAFLCLWRQLSQHCLRSCCLKTNQWSYLDSQNFSSLFPNPRWNKIRAVHCFCRCKTRRTKFKIGFVDWKGGVYICLIAFHCSWIWWRKLGKKKVDFLHYMLQLSWVFLLQNCLHSSSWKMETLLLIPTIGVHRGTLGVGRKESHTSHQCLIFILICCIFSPSTEKPRFYFFSPLFFPPCCQGPL